MTRTREQIIRYRSGRKPTFWMQRRCVSSFLLPPSSFSTHLGLTLVELVLAVTLFSTLLASVAGLIGSGLRAQLTWGTVVEPYRRMEAAFGRLEADLESAQPFFGVPVSGTEDTVEFARVDLAPGPEGQSANDWIRLIYRVEAGAQEAVLVREAFLWRQSQQTSEPWRRDALLPVVTGRFLYGALDAQQQLIWVDSWDGKTQGVPRLVRFDCTLPAAGGQAPVQLSRVIRNPAGTLPIVEEP